jgi:rhodanese-related sulfurtransferase
MGMNVIVIYAALFCGLIVGWVVVRRLRARRELAEKSIEPEALHELLKTNSKVLLFDVRRPLDVLAHPEIIPGAIRVEPEHAAELTVKYSRDQEAVIYCTGADDDTGHMVLGKVRALHFTRVKLLRGGLAAWKATGYPVEAYTESFHLDTAS